MELKMIHETNTDGTCRIDLIRMCYEGEEVLLEDGECNSMWVINVFKQTGEQIGVLKGLEYSHITKAQKYKAKIRTIAMYGGREFTTCDLALNAIANVGSELAFEIYKKAIFWGSNFGLPPTLDGCIRKYNGIQDIIRIPFDSNRRRKNEYILINIKEKTIEVEEMGPIKVIPKSKGYTWDDGGHERISTADCEADPDMCCGYDH